MKEKTDGFFFLKHLWPNVIFLFLCLAVCFPTLVKTHYYTWALLYCRRFFFQPHQHKGHIAYPWLYGSGLMCTIRKYTNKGKITAREIGLKWKTSVSRLWWNSRTSDSRQTEWKETAATMVKKERKTEVRIWNLKKKENEKGEWMTEKMIESNKWCCLLCEDEVSYFLLFFLSLRIKKGKKMQGRCCHGTWRTLMFYP